MLLFRGTDRTSTCTHIKKKTSLKKRALGAPITEGTGAQTCVQSRPFSSWEYSDMMRKRNNKNTQKNPSVLPLIFSLPRCFWLIFLFKNEFKHLMCFLCFIMTKIQVHEICKSLFYFHFILCPNVFGNWVVINNYNSVISRICFCTNIGFTLHTLYFNVKTFFLLLK